MVQNKGFDWLEMIVEATFRGKAFAQACEKAQIDLYYGDVAD